GVDQRVRVVMVRRGDDDGVEVLALVDQFAVVFVRLDVLRRPSGLLDDLHRIANVAGVGIAQCCNLEVRYLGEITEVVVPPAAAADQGDGYLIVGTRLFFLGQNSRGGSQACTGGTDKLTTTDAAHVSIS